MNLTETFCSGILGGIQEGAFAAGMAPITRQKNQGE
jgi:hypothetical protein